MTTMYLEFIHDLNSSKGIHATCTMQACLKAKSNGKGQQKGREIGIKYHIVFQLAELNGGVFFNRQFVGSARKSGLNYAITLALLHQQFGNNLNLQS